jgi:metal transporter CNNM
LCVRYGLVIGAFFAWPVRILMWIIFPIAYPISRLLDWVLGHQDGVIYRRAGKKFLGILSWIFFSTVRTQRIGCFAW